jgi:hypothetical protein
MAETKSKAAAKPAVAKASVAKAAPAKKPAAKKVAAPKKTVAPKKAAAPKKTAAKKPAAKPRKISPEERYRMVAVAAYFIAERNSFAGSPVGYWTQAEVQISKMLSK